MTGEVTGEETLLQDAARLQLQLYQLYHLCIVSFLGDGGEGNSDVVDSVQLLI